MPPFPKEQRHSPLHVVYNASVEVRASIVFATFIILLCSCRFSSWPASRADCCVRLGVAYTVSLFASLVVAVTLTPALCYLLLAKQPRCAEGT